MLKEGCRSNCHSPRTPTSAAGDAPPTLSIAADGSGALDGSALANDDLARAAGHGLAGREDKSVMLAADRRLAYARVVEVMHARRAARIERIDRIRRRFS